MSVSAKVEIVIKDACILFDLIDLSLLPSFYQLPLVVVTTPQVLAEITDEAQFTEINTYVESGQLQIDSFGLLETITSIIDTKPGLSFTDASVIEVAIRRDAVILSSDKSLRNESTRRGIIVHGLLWVLEELFNQDIITLNALVEKLEAYPNVNKRAPKIEIENLLRKYNC
jgi:rRNA-processing protein FCF1